MSDKMKYRIVLGLTLTIAGLIGFGFIGAPVNADDVETGEPPVPTFPRCDEGEDEFGNCNGPLNPDDYCVINGADVVCQDTPINQPFNMPINQPATVGLPASTPLPLPFEIDCSTGVINELGHCEPVGMIPVDLQPEVVESNVVIYSNPVPEVADRLNIYFKDYRALLAELVS